MKYAPCRFSIIAVMLLTGAALAQPVTAPATQPASPFSYVLPEVNFEGVPLDSVVDYIRDLVPNLNLVIVRSPGVSDDYPMLQKIRLKNVTVEQFFQLIKQSYEHLELEGDETLAVIRITGPRVESEMQTETVQVYPLRSIVQVLADQKPVLPDVSVQEQALNDVLSLIEAAMKEKGGAKPVIKVHPPTQTLLFKGDSRSQEVVERVLQALQPDSVSAFGQRSMRRTSRPTTQPRPTE
jgi:hypothetical protein